MTVASALVSVIVPVYNGERFLAQALDSILGQDYRPIEVLVVDDGSTDGSAGVAAGFPMARLLRKSHSGLAATLNHGIRHAGGELFAFLDADDRWLAGKLARQVEALRLAPGLDMVFGHVREFQVRPGPAGEEEIFSGPRQAVCKSAMLVRRTSFQRIGGFAEQADRHDFLDWYARALAGGLRQEMLTEVLAERRIHAENMGRTNPARQRAQYLSTLRDVVNRRRGQFPPVK